MNMPYFLEKSIYSPQKVKEGYIKAILNLMEECNYKVWSQVGGVDSSGKKRLVTVEELNGMGIMRLRHMLNGLLDDFRGVC